MELAKASGVSEVFHRRAEQRRVHAEWKVQPLWIRAIAVLAMIIFVVGAILSRFAPPIEWNIIGLLMILVPLGLFWLMRRSSDGKPER